MSFFFYESSFFAKTRPLRCSPPRFMPKVMFLFYSLLHFLWLILVIHFFGSNASFLTHDPTCVLLEPMALPNFATNINSVEPTHELHLPLEPLTDPSSALGSSYSPHLIVATLHESHLDPPSHVNHPMVT